MTATQIDTYICDGNATGQCRGRHTKVNYTYSYNGNVLQEDHYGDISNPGNTQLNSTVVRTYVEAYMNSAIVFPKSVSIFQGIGSSNVSPNLMVSKTDYYYDDLAAANCNATPTNNYWPTKGNLTRTVKWLQGGTDSETRTAYDAVGNAVCSRDANGNVTTTAYDETFQTFPTTVTNAKLHPVTTRYYGVGTAADKGSFGQVQLIADPNGATVTTEYDVFGRKKQELKPDNFWTRTDYNSFGTVGDQHIYTYNSLNLRSKSYFDGMGRTIKVKSGPVNKVIANETKYDQNGRVKSESLPYFDGVDAPVYREYTYDLLGRVTKIINPDKSTINPDQNTFSLACYNDLVTARIDENGHGKRETRDPLGRLVKIEEYTGTFTHCDTSMSEGILYATTTYIYDVLGNLTGIDDGKKNSDGIATPNHTAITYDTLGRITKKVDPDMGTWDFTYYPDGTINTIKDANHQLSGQLISFEIDSLNRVTSKTYPADADLAVVRYYYDGENTTPPPANPKGRRTSMSDGSGSTVWHYDSFGRATKTVKKVGNEEYTVQKAYDGLGRLRSITYPGDITPVEYLYDEAGNLWKIPGYAEYAEFNAFGKPGKLTYGNGVVTRYSYYPLNNRLHTIKAELPPLTLMDITYDYYDNGNIKSVDDSVSDAMAHNFFGTVSFTPATKPVHAPQSTNINGITQHDYQYDDNGNMKSDGSRTMAYNPDNMPTSITMNGGTTTYIYDGNGKRVRKSSPVNEMVYIDNLYECVNGYCDKHIFAGNARVAIVTPTQTFYHHADHLGSTSVVTINDGSKVEAIAYYPFGETRSDNSSVYLYYKYTGQEQDRETGLYNYGARLYDTELGRFITPDSIVPDYTNPQSLNRFAYVLNNPMRFVDPTGHAPNEYYEWGPWPASDANATIQSATNQSCLALGTRTDSVNASIMREGIIKFNQEIVEPLSLFYGANVGGVLLPILRAEQAAAKMALAEDFLIPSGIRATEGTLAEVGIVRNPWGKLGGPEHQEIMVPRRFKWVTEKAC